MLLGTFSTLFIWLTDSVQRHPIYHQGYHKLVDASKLEAFLLSFRVGCFIVFQSLIALRPEGVLWITLRAALAPLFAWTCLQLLTNVFQLFFTGISSSIYWKVRRSPFILDETFFAIFSTVGFVLPAQRLDQEILDPRAFNIFAPFYLCVVLFVLDALLIWQNAPNSRRPAPRIDVAVFFSCSDILLVFLVLLGRRLDNLVIIPTLYAFIPAFLLLVSTIVRFRQKILSCSLW